MRRPSSNHHGGVSSLTWRPGSRCSASTRARFDAATALWAMVSTLSEVESIQPELGAQRPPELPRSICASLEVVAHEVIHGGLREQMPAAPPRIAQELHGGRAPSIPQPVADGSWETFLVAPPDEAIGQKSIERAPQAILRPGHGTFDAVRQRKRQLH